VEPDPDVPVEPELPVPSLGQWWVADVPEPELPELLELPELPELPERPGLELEPDVVVDVEDAAVPAEWVAFASTRYWRRPDPRRWRPARRLRDLRPLCLRFPPTRGRASLSSSSHSLFPLAASLLALHRLRRSLNQREPGDGHPRASCGRSGEPVAHRLQVKDRSIRASAAATWKRLRRR